MIRAVHIEDEPGNIELLESLVKANCADLVKLEGNARNLTDAFKLINEKQPQLVYLDIELNQGNAFELLAMFGEINFEVIFISAFSEYALKAFRVNALDYILKPISIEELRNATVKAVNKINQSISATNNKLVNVLNQIKADFSISKIGIPIVSGLLFINYEDIVSIEASNSNSVICFINGEKVVCIKNLRFLEKLLPETSFLRVHPSWIIHIKYVKKFFRGKTGHLEMENGAKITVSARKRMSLFRHLFR